MIGWVAVGCWVLVMALVVGWLRGPRRCLVCGRPVRRWAHRPVVFWREGWRFAHRGCVALSEADERLLLERR
jgi:hypothetical protein